MPSRLLFVWLSVCMFGVVVSGSAAAATSVTPTVEPSVDGPSAGPMRLAGGSERWQPGFGVERHPIVRLVFWGPDWEHDSTGVVAGIETFFRELPDSAWGSVLEQYGVHDDARLAGVLIDPSRPPRRTALTHADAAAEADRARRILRSGTAGQWIVLPQAGTNLARLAGECGEHDALKSGGREYLVDLVLADAMDCSGLGISDETDAQRLVFAYTIAVSHEFAEAATDSEGIGWADSSGNEIADVCTLTDSVPVDMTVATAGLWSNQAGGCVPWWPNEPGSALAPRLRGRAEAWPLAWP